MSNFIKWLQWFADGASGGDGGGDGAGTGVSSADAGQSTGVTVADAGQRLEDLGVPKDKADRYRQRMAKKKPSADAVKPPQPEKTAEKKSDTPPAELKSEEQAKPNMDFDTFMAIPENKQRLQAMMAERGKNATEAKNAAQDQLGKIAPLLELLGTRYSLESKNGHYDLDALIKAATDDDYFFEDQALDRGETVEKVKSDWKQQQEQAAQQRQDRERQLQEHFAKMQQQANVLREEYPNFDLGKELGNPEFVRLANSQELGGMGWDVRKAFRAVHQDEIERGVAEVAARKSLADAARAVQSGQARPRENGNSSAAVNTTPNLKTMSRDERRAYMRAKYPPPG